MSEISKRFNITYMYPTSLQSFTFLFFLTVMNLDISFLTIHYETVDVNVYMYIRIMYSNTPLSIQNSLVLSVLSQHFIVSYMFSEYCDNEHYNNSNYCIKLL